MLPVAARPRKRIHLIVFLTWPGMHPEYFRMPIFPMNVGPSVDVNFISGMQISWTVQPFTKSHMHHNSECLCLERKKRYVVRKHRNDADIRVLGRIDYCLYRSQRANSVVILIVYCQPGSEHFGRWTSFNNSGSRLDVKTIQLKGSPHNVKKQHEHAMTQEVSLITRWNMRALRSKSHDQQRFLSLWVNDVLKSFKQLWHHKQSHICAKICPLSRGIWQSLGVNCSFARQLALEGLELKFTKPFLYQKMILWRQFPLWLL